MHVNGAADAIELLGSFKINILGKRDGGPYFLGGLGMLLFRRSLDADYPAVQLGLGFEYPMGNDVKIFLESKVMAAISFQLGIATGATRLDAYSYIPINLGISFD